jgi:hypothetical protein
VTKTARGGLAAALAALIGCGGQSPGEGPAPGAPVSGSRLNTYYQDDGTTLTTVAPDLAQTGLSAWVLESGGYREAPGSFGPDGAWTIPGVGAGSYLLQVTPPGLAPRYYQQSARAVDLGNELVGRPSRLFATLSSPLTLSLTGLEPWATGDSVTVFSTGSRLASSATSTVNAIPSATAADFTIDLRGRPLPAAGDLGWVLQWAQRTAGASASTYSVVTRTAALVSLATMADGDVVTLAAPMSAPAVTGTVGLDLRRSEFAAAFPAMFPTARQLGTPGFTVSLRAYPRTLSSALFAPLLTFTPPAGTTDLDLGTLTYPRPYPAWFTEVRVTDVSYQQEVPGAFGAAGFSGVFTLSRIEPLSGAPAVIAPALGPPRLPLIAGRDLLRPQGGVGLTPTLAWSAPALGTATRYLVTINELSGGGVASRASLTVFGTSVGIPPLVLVPGSVYYATILAVAEPNFDPARPNRLTAPRDQVPLLTAPFTP